MNIRIQQGILASLLIVFAATARLFPHPANVAPIAALALLGGATLSFPWSFVIPGAAMLVSDIVIGFDRILITLSVYGSFFLISLLGRFLQTSYRPWRILGTSLAGSILFYLITNAAVWQFSGLYPTTPHGLLLSYLYALPFFRHTLLGDMAYTFSLFSALYGFPFLLRLRLRSQKQIMTAIPNISLTK